MDIRFKLDDLLFKVRATGVIIINNKILVEEYDNDKYSLPGGYLNIGESSIDGIKREIKEEVTEVEIEKYLGLIENIFTNRKGQLTQEINFYYKVNPKNINDINLNDYTYEENDHGYKIVHNFKWFDIKEIYNINLIPLEIRKDIMNSLENNIVFHKILKEND